MSRIVAVALLVTVAACSGGNSGTPPPASAPTTPPAVPGSYTADQLTQALLAEINGYRQAGIPQSGRYGSLAAVQNSGEMQQAARIDKPQCLPRPLAADPAVHTAPAALTAFTKASQSASEVLLAVGPDIAARQVRQRVTAGCRAFHVKVGRRWSPATLVEPRSARIGEGSRTVGVATAGTRTWTVVLRSRGYLATITLFGPTATQTEAESLARQAYQQAERILP